MLNLVDFYGGTLLIFALAMFEMAAVFWIYGIENFCWDLEYMTGRKASLYWRICWCIVTPVFMIFIFVYSMATFTPLQYSGWDYPDTYTALGWAIFGVGFAMFPVMAVVALVRTRKTTVWSTVVAACVPSETWGPEDRDHYVRWKLFKATALERRMKQALEGGHGVWKQKLYILLGWYRTEI